MNHWLEYSAAIEDLYLQMVSPVFKKHGLTFMEFTVLMFLHNNPQYNTASEIVKYRHLTKSHVSLAVQTLKQKNLIDCQYQGKNRRSIHLYVQENASEIIQDGILIQKEFRAILHDGLNEEEIDRINQYTEHINQNITMYMSKLKEKK